MKIKAKIGAIENNKKILLLLLLVSLLPCHASTLIVYTHPQESHVKI